MNNFNHKYNKYKYKYLIYKKLLKLRGGTLDENEINENIKIYEQILEYITTFYSDNSNTQNGGITLSSITSLFSNNDDLILTEYNKILEKIKHLNMNKIYDDYVDNDIKNENLSIYENYKNLFVYIINLNNIKELNNSKKLNDLIFLIKKVEPDYSLNDLDINILYKNNDYEKIIQDIFKNINTLIDKFYKFDYLNMIKDLINIFFISLNDNISVNNLYKNFDEKYFNNNINLKSNDEKKNIIMEKLINININYKLTDNIKNIWSQIYLNITKNDDKNILIDINSENDIKEHKIFNEYLQDIIDLFNKYVNKQTIDFSLLQKDDKIKVDENDDKIKSDFSLLQNDETIKDDEKNDIPIFECYYEKINNFFMTNETNYKNNIDFYDSNNKILIDIEYIKNKLYDFFDSIKDLKMNLNSENYFKSLKSLYHFNNIVNYKNNKIIININNNLYKLDYISDEIYEKNYNELNKISFNEKNYNKIFKLLFFISHELMNRFNRFFYNNINPNIHFIINPIIKKDYLKIKCDLIKMLILIFCIEISDKKILTEIKNILININNNYFTNNKLNLLIIQDTKKENIDLLKKNFIEFNNNEKLPIYIKNIYYIFNKIISYIINKYFNVNTSFFKNLFNSKEI